MFGEEPFLLSIFNERQLTVKFMLFSSLSYNFSSENVAQRQRRAGSGVRPLFIVSGHCQQHQQLLGKFLPADERL